MKQVLSLSRIRVILLFGLVCSLAGCGGSIAPGTTQPPPEQYPFTAAPGYKWVQQFAASDLYTPVGFSVVTTETITALASDANGNVYASGYDLGSFNGASNPNKVAYNFIVKYDSTGALQWVHQFGTGFGDFLESIGVDASGDIYAAGVTLGSLPGYTNPNAGSFNQMGQGALYKFDPSGSLVWQKEFAPSNGPVENLGLTIDPSGNVLLGGAFSPAVGSSTNDLFFQKIDGTSGEVLWNAEYGGVGDLDGFQQLTGDSNGDMYAAGTTTKGIPGQSAGLLLKFSGDTGSLVWTTSPAASGIAYSLPFGVAVANGAVVVGGEASDQSVLYGANAYSGEEAYLASFSSATGATNWTKTISSGQGDTITGVTFAKDGTIFAVGATNGVFAAGFTQPLQDRMVFQFAPDGTDLTALQSGTGLIINQAANVGPQITSSSAGQIYVGGPVQVPFAGFTNASSTLQMFISRLQ